MSEGADCFGLMEQPLAYSARQIVEYIFFVYDVGCSGLNNGIHHIFFHSERTS
jgi:hypothetical protein